jgi:hypothetical protein
MRLSGTYFDKLILNVLPWTIFAALFIYFLKKDFNVYVLLILTSALWLIDTLIICIKFKKPKTLKISTALLLGNETLNPKNIVKITPVTDNRMKWSFKMIEFTLIDGRTFMIIDKPKTFIQDVMNKPSKTLKMLFAKYPELKSKLEATKSI